MRDELAVTSWVPRSFSDVVSEVHRGQQPRVRVRDLVVWFGFQRRGSVVNGYIREAMRVAGVTCSPALDSALHDEELVFTSLQPIVVLAPVPAPLRLPPHPIAIFDSIIAAQADLSRRVATRLDAIERAIAFLVFAQLATLRSAEGYPDAVRQQLSELLPTGAGAGPAVSFGTWVNLARHLASRTTQSDPLLDVSRDLFARQSGTKSLGVTLESEVVPQRNLFRHASNVSDNSWKEADLTLGKVYADLKRALVPLIDSELVCVHSTEVSHKHAYRYALRTLHGSDSFFPTRTLDTNDKLTTGWAYLLRPNTTPLRLAPGIFCEEDSATEQVKLFFSRSLALDAGQRISLLSVVGGTERKEALPL